MAKHAVFAGLTFMTIIAFSAVSAYKTTIVTTIIEGNKWTWPYNGLDNGRGYVDGLTLNNGQRFIDNGQGLVDGLDNGQGLVDGLDNGQGLVDGLHNGQGLVDGLDNGQGLVDGMDNGQGLVDSMDSGSGQGLADGVGNGSGQGLADGVGNGSGEGLADGVGNGSGQGLADGVGNGSGQGFEGLDNGSGQGFDVLENGSGQGFDVLDNGSGHGFDGLDNRSGQGLADGLNNPTSSQQCRSQIPIEQLNHCKMHLTQGIIFDTMSVRPLKLHHQEQHLQQCCSQLKQVNEKCQCAAIQQVFNKAWQQEGGLEKVSQIASEAYKLPNACGLKVQDCQLKVPRV